LTLYFLQTSKRDSREVFKQASIGADLRDNKESQFVGEILWFPGIDFPFQFSWPIGVSPRASNTGAHIGNALFPTLDADFYEIKEEFRANLSKLRIKKLLSF
jgi:hypothetical protein